VLGGLGLVKVLVMLVLMIVWDCVAKNFDWEFSKLIGKTGFRPFLRVMDICLQRQEWFTSFRVFFAKFIQSHGDHSRWHVDSVALESWEIDVSRVHNLAIVSSSLNKRVVDGLVAIGL
jgi:hypothetical protein